MAFRKLRVHRGREEEGENKRKRQIWDNFDKTWHDKKLDLYRFYPNSFSTALNLDIKVDNRMK